MGIEQVKMPLVFNKGFLYCCKLLVNFWCSKKLTLAIFMKKRFLRWPLPTIFADVTLSSV